MTFSSSGACSTSGATFTMTSGTGDVLGLVRPGGGAGTTRLHRQVVRVGHRAERLSQVIAVTTHAPASAVFGASFGWRRTRPGGVGIYALEQRCLLELGQHVDHDERHRDVSVLYDQVGSANYAAAPQVVESVSAVKAAQAIAVSTHAPASAVFGTSFGVAGNAAGGVVTFSSTGACTNSGSVVHHDERHGDVLGGCTTRPESVNTLLGPSGRRVGAPRSRLARRSRSRRMGRRPRRSARRSRWRRRRRGGPGDVLEQRCLLERWCDCSR